MKKLFFIAVILGFGLYSVDSSAQLFRLNVSQCGSLNASDCNTLRTELLKVQKEINEDFPSTEDPKRLMQGMANSSVMAGKGIGSDYASRMQVFMIGGGVGVGADLEKDKQTDSDLSGVGVQGGVVIGTNLSWMDTEKILGLYTNRLNVYVNYLGFNLDRKMGENDKDSIKAKLNSFGFHANYDLVEPVGSNWLRWGGLKIHTGFEYNTTKVTFASTLSEDVSETVSGQTVTGTITGRPAASINVATQSIPVEISTNVQILYLLSLYGGLGVDFNFGEAKSNGNLNADESTLEINGGDTGTRVQAEANISGKSKVDSMLTRGFAGVQINLPYMNIFAQVDKAFGNDLIGGTAGLRIVY